MFKNLKNHFGQSLLSVIAAATIGGVVIMGLYSGLSSFLKSSRLVAGGPEIAVLKAQIQGLIGQDAICAKILKDASGSAAKFNPDVILPANPTQAQIDSYKKANTLAQIALGSLVLAKTGSGGSNYSVSSISLIELDKTLRTRGSFNGTSVTNVTSKLTLVLNKGGTPGTSHGVLSTIDFPLFVAINNSNFLVEKCSGGAPGPADARQVLQCTTVTARGLPGAGSAGVIPTCPDPRQWQTECEMIAAPVGDHSCGPTPNRRNAAGQAECFSGCTPVASHAGTPQFWYGRATCCMIVPSP